MKKWQLMIKDAYDSVNDLGERLGIRQEEMERLLEIEEKYPVLIPEYYLSLVDASDHDDPIRRMCVPDAMEFSVGGSADTSGESDNTVVQGMQHKYSRTAMILSTNQCAMYCRHCFRKRLVGLSSEEIATHIPEMVEYVKAHKEINNILISGGDALLNSNETIRRYLEAFTSLDNISFIRLGTRTPVTLPQRITEDDGELLSILEEFEKKKHIIVVTQFNHPHELTAEAEKAVRAIRKTGCSVRNQTVLLKGVNDDPDVLSSLMNGLVDKGVMPYYLFQCRPVEGVKNQFQVPFVRGVDIVEKAKAKMSGIAKAFRYVLSHPTGKIEILGAWDGKMLFRYHQAKYGEDNSRMFTRKIIEEECWF